ncbi:MAG TPA: DUF2721 domain-containing protein [Nevskiaceae bacterium]|nr:DUF2721 domain-containing protein [Nevskiaceae bacterium]
MLESLGGTDVSHVIQLAVAPVFLLAGIGSILGVMTNRLARVVDNARVLEGRLPSSTPEQQAHLHARLRTLAQRAKLISRAIALCTLTALLVCATIILLFVGAFFGVNAALPAALLFISALISFASALVMFLREIFLATANLRIGAGEHIQR